MTGEVTLLIAAGEISDQGRLNHSLNNATRIIAVDGGIRHLRSLDMVPALVVGDLDSAEEENLQWAAESGAEIILLANQSESDLAKALNLCHEREWDEIIIDGIEGGRHDHLLGSFAAITNAHQSLNITANLTSAILYRFVAGYSGLLSLSGTFSIFSFGRTNVTLLGPEWELNDEEITFSTRGLSNVGNCEAELAVHSGDPLFILINQ